MNHNSARPGKMCVVRFHIEPFRATAILAHESSNSSFNCERLEDDLIAWTIAAERRLCLEQFDQSVNDRDRASLTLLLQERVFEHEGKRIVNDVIALRLSEHFKFRLNEICILYQISITSLLRLVIDTVIAEAVFNLTFKSSDDDNH